MTKTPDYWDIIRWDAATFLTPHSGPGSELYRGKLQRSPIRDLVHGVRAVVGGSARMMQGFLAAALLRRLSPLAEAEPYVLAIVPGSAKYAGEEKELEEACRSRGLTLRTIPLARGEEALLPKGTVSPGLVLRPVDYLRAWTNWVPALLRGSHYLLARDAKARSLFVFAIPGLRQHCLHTAFARRVLRNMGKPSFVLSLAPWSAVSVSVIDFMKKNGVPTAGIRTQTTPPYDEHLAINSDVLFYKSCWEKDAYEATLHGRGPRLLEGCLLSLPRAYDLEPLSLPARYVLLLGTALSYDQSLEDCRLFNETLGHVARASGLPVVFKGHPADDWMAGLPGSEAAVGREFVVVRDVSRNRELIERASLVVSAPSTLLYHAILEGVPVLIVDTHSGSEWGPDEFETAPIARIGHEQAAQMDHLDWESLYQSADAAKQWFEESYYLRKGLDHMIECLMDAQR